MRVVLILILDQVGVLPSPHKDWEHPNLLLLLLNLSTWELLSNTLVQFVSNYLINMLVFLCPSLFQDIFSLFFLFLIIRGFGEGVIQGRGSWLKQVSVHHKWPLRVLDRLEEGVTPVLKPPLMMLLQIILVYQNFTLVHILDGLNLEAEFAPSFEDLDEFMALSPICGLAKLV